VRTRIRWCPQTGKKVAEWAGDECVYYDYDYFHPENKAPVVMGDLPAYQSPIDGRTVEGRKQRRDDLARNHSRPWEGLEAEKKEAARQKAEIERKADAKLNESAWRAWYELSPDKRKILRGT
jgi:hypothetical protein